MGERLLLDGGYTNLDGDNRDLRLRGTWDDGDLVVRASAYWLLEEQSLEPYEFDPYFETLGELQPYAQYQLILSKDLVRDLRLDLGGDLRRLEDGGDEGTFNHDYERGYATLALQDVFVRGLALSATGDYWNSDAQDLGTWGLDATWQPEKAWRASLGSNYQMYRYDVTGETERDDVRVWYVRVRRDVGAAWTFALGYDHESADSGDYDVFQAGATWHF